MSPGAPRVFLQDKQAELGDAEQSERQSLDVILVGMMTLRGLLLGLVLDHALLGRSLGARSCVPPYLFRYDDSQDPKLSHLWCISAEYTLSRTPYLPEISDGIEIVAIT